MLLEIECSKKINMGNEMSMVDYWNTYVYMHAFWNLVKKQMLMQGFQHSKMSQPPTGK